MRIATLALLGAAALAAPAAVGQTTAADSLSLFAAPAYLGRATALTTASPNLNVVVRSMRVRGSWDVCAEANYAGGCQTITANQPLINMTVRSARPTPTSTTIGGTTPTASTTAGINLDTLDAAAGTTGQDVDFYVTPAFGGDQVSAGTNDRTAADAFCKRAGAVSSVYAGRSRVQASNLIDLSGATKVRGYALRDVLCRR